MRLLTLMISTVHAATCDPERGGAREQRECGGAVSPRRAASRGEEREERPRGRNEAAGGGEARATGALRLHDQGVMSW